MARSRCCLHRTLEAYRRYITAEVRLLLMLQVDNQIAMIQSTMDQRLSSMAPSAKQAYNELLAEQAALLAEAGRFETDIAELNEALAAAEGELGRNQVKQRALQLQVCAVAVWCRSLVPVLLVMPIRLKLHSTAALPCAGDAGALQLHTAPSAACQAVSPLGAVSCVLPLQEQVKLLTERKYELAAAEDASKASPEEQQATFMARIKRDNAAVEQTTSEAKRLQDEVRQLEAAVAAANSKQSGRSAAGEVPPAQDEESRRCGCSALRRSHCHSCCIALQHV